jgi:hypothetical protein
MKSALRTTLLAIACAPADAPRAPVIVPLSGHVAAVVDRWQPSCPTPAPIYASTWDSTLADTVIIFAAPHDPDTIASLFGVSRRPEGGYWYDYQGRGGEALSGTDSMSVGPWVVVAGQYEAMTYVDDIDIPVDESGRAAPEHSRQSWFYAFAPADKGCAVVLSWRSPPVGSYRGPRYAEWEISPDSLRQFIERVQWRERKEQ